MYAAIYLCMCLDNGVLHKAKNLAWCPSPCGRVFSPGMGIYIYLLYIYSWRIYLERFVFDDRFASQWRTVDHVNEHPAVKRAQEAGLQHFIALVLADRGRCSLSGFATAGHSWDPAQRPSQTRLRGRADASAAAANRSNDAHEVAFFAALAGGRLHEMVIRPVGR